MLDLMNIKAGSVHPASYASVYLRQMCNDKTGEAKEVGHGTGFIYQASGRNFLITNWHVVTRCNPDTNQLVDHNPSPEWLEFNLSQLDNKLHFLPGTINLYEDGKPVWLEMGNLEYRADIVAIPIQFPDNARVVPINNACDSSQLVLDIGQEVFIVGFPFIQSNEHLFPIWKRATIASEPSIALQRKPRFYLDTPGKPGMSGSPVYVAKKGLSASKDVKAMIERLEKGESITNTDIDILNPKHFGREMNILQFAGIYSGSYGDKNLDYLNLGICWNGFMIQKLFENSICGSNPSNPYD